MKDKLVTVIGGGGFVGRYVAQALMKTGARIRIAQRDPRRAWFLRPLSALGQTQFIAADVTRPDSIARAVDGADVVINLVGVLAGNFQRYHVDGARTVAEAAAKAGTTTLVHVSAIGADAGSASAYGRSKGEGEAAVRAAFPNAVIVRPSIVFGREDAFINRFAGMIAKTPVVPVVRAGVRFQPVFAGDVGEAIGAIVADPGASAGKTYELGGPDILSMGEIIRWIAQAIGRTPTIVEVPDAAGAMIARAGFLPFAPITWDQWLMLQRDNVVANGGTGFEAFGIAPAPLAAVALTWLVRYRRHGRFSLTAA
ncbi:MAG TPA: complex I NDUFA9 subunit family protein [Sphingomonas sp.]|nr:complex I NDUFA9 subunit family protein [Sphingomonas sp.]